MSVGELEPISIHAISRAAEKQCLQLDTRFLRELLDVVFDPIPRHECRAVRQLRRYDVYHFSINKTVRVSYARIQGRNCIVDVGVHKDFNAFACRFDGVHAEQIIPLQESSLMKKKFLSANDLSDKTTDPASSDQLPSATSNSSNYELAGTLLDLIGKMCNETIDNHIASKVLENEDRLQSLEDGCNKQNGLLESLDEAVQKIGAAQQQLREAQQETLQTQNADAARWEQALQHQQLQQLQQTQTLEQVRQLEQQWQTEWQAHVEANYETHLQSQEQIEQQTLRQDLQLQRLEIVAAEIRQQAADAAVEQRSAHAQLQAAQAETSQNLDAMTSQVHLLQAANQTLTAQNQSLQRELSQLKKQWQATDLRAEQFEQRVAERFLHHADQQDRLTENLTRVADLVAELQVKSAQLENEVPQLGRQLTELTSLVNALESYRQKQETDATAAAERATNAWWRRWFQPSKSVESPE